MGGARCREAFWDCGPHYCLAVNDDDLGEKTHKAKNSMKDDRLHTAVRGRDEGSGMMVVQKRCPAVVVRWQSAFPGLDASCSVVERYHGAIGCEEFRKQPARVLALPVGIPSGSLCGAVTLKQRQRLLRPSKHDHTTHFSFFAGG